MDGKLVEVELKKIRPNRLNPRLEINIIRLNDLADSIKQVGLLEPLIVRPIDNGYEVVCGERRYRACQQVGLKTVPVVVREYTDEEVLERAQEERAKPTPSRLGDLQYIPGRIV